MVICSHQYSETINLKEEISGKVRAKVDDNQREYILKEQLEILNKELGQDEYSETNELEEKIDKLNASDEVKDKLHKEVKRLKNLSKGSSEVNVERTYIENCLELPWNNMSEDNNDIINARKVLDNDHYGMKDIKDRIIEALAVRNIISNTEAPILCLVGPPGTGKTSIARSVAAALNKEYVRICLGGVRDEAEIRGHRKTYVGAMPGRIIEGLKKAGTANPLMLLDEKSKSDELVNTKIILENKDVLDIYDIKKQLEKLPNRKIWLKCGGFITIDKTEALTAIDVNTGKYTGNRNLEQTLYKVNEEATVEIAKQLRLRDIGGIIIIDYIDMKKKENK